MHAGSIVIDCGYQILRCRYQSYNILQLSQPTTYCVIPNWQSKSIGWQPFPEKYSTNTKNDTQCNFQINCKCVRAIEILILLSPFRIFCSTQNATIHCYESYKALFQCHDRSTFTWFFSIQPISSSILAQCPDTCCKLSNISLHIIAFGTISIDCTITTHPKHRSSQSNFQI